jgi:hypothetical protein
VNSRIATGLVIVIALSACSGTSGTTPTTQAATTTIAISAPVPPAPVEGLPETRPDLLAAIVLFPGELPEPYQDLPFDPIESGYRPAGADLAHALDPGDEADDIIRYGVLAELTTAFGGIETLSIATEAVEFALAEGAGGYLNDWVADLSLASSEAASGSVGLTDFTSSPIEGLGEEAVRVEYVTLYQIAEGEDRAIPGAAAAIRSGRIVVWIWASGDSASDAVDDLDDILAARLRDAAVGALDGRDPDLLGLSEPPTAQLTSFVFEYRYGFEAGDGSFEVVIDGVFEGPDRTECRIATSQAGEEPTISTVVAAGTTVWIGDRSGYVETPLRDPAALSFLSACPGHPLFWEVTRFHRLPTDGATPSTVREIEVLEVDLVGNEGALADLGFLEDEAAQFTRYEIAVARDGGWLVELHTERETDLPTAMLAFGIPSAGVHPGVPARLYDSFTIGHPNDPALRVEPPLLAG